MARPKRDPKTEPRKRLLCHGCKKPYRTPKWGSNGYCRDCNRTFRETGEKKNGKIIRSDQNTETKSERRALRDKSLRQTAAILAKASDKYGNVVDIIDGMVNLHGGIDKFCQDWKSQVDIAARDNPGSKTVLDYYHNMVKLHMEAAQHRPNNSDIDDMDLDDVSAEIVRITDEMGLTVYSTPEEGEETAIDAEFEVLEDAAFEEDEIDEETDGQEARTA